MMNLAKTLVRNINKKAQLLLSFFIIFVLISCNIISETIVINGFTMGTTYSIKIVNTDNINNDTDILKTKIDSILVEVNKQMSTYIDDSEISIFNERQDNHWQVISKEFYSVICKAFEISKITDGAFDITVGPLMDLWGFGLTNQDDWQPPTHTEVQNIIKSIGFRNIEMDSNSIRKTNPNIIIDLNAIAKGCGVDVVFELLSELGYKDILVEIGGELRCSGFNQNGDIWKIGIDKPILDILPGTDLQELIALKNSALATSGDYRNYFHYNDKMYSHTINPLTGYPVENGIASASVIAPNCMLADALATALMVMGASGLPLIEKLDEVEALLVKRLSENEYNTIKSSGWKFD